MENYTEDDYALCSRFKSEKKKKRLVKEDFEKELRQNYNQRKQLFNAVWNSPPVPLDKPYQKGWVRFFVLRADVLVGPNSGFFMNLLEKINTYHYSIEKSFTTRNRKFGKKISVPSEQFLKMISISDWDCKKINLTEKEKTYFTLIYYRFDEPWRFVLRVRPNIITHKKPVDSDLQSELQVLENYITNYNLNHKITD